MAATPHALRLSNRTFAPEEMPLIMGILNVTPDSFSDGGVYASPQAAIDRGLAMLAEGAAIIDVGPESTRPGSQPVAAAEQIRRAVPVIAGLRRAAPSCVLSIDTRLAPVAKEAIAAGADLVNDTSALRDDPALAAVIAESKAGVVLMHRRGTPADMQNDGGPHYDDVVGEIAAFVHERCEFARTCGIDPDRIVIDPGLGFGKRLEHNLEILRRLDRFVALGRPLLVGASRKRFIGEITGVDDPTQRLAGSLACAIVAAQAGAAVLRVHDVAETVQTLRLLRAIEA